MAKSDRIAQLKEQTQKASVALLQYLEKVEEKKESSDLFESDPETILLSVGLSRIPDKAFKSFKAKKIHVPHPLTTVDDDSEICLLVKDKKEAKAWLERDGVKCVKKVIDLQQLRTQYNTYKDRRDLANLYDVFIADDRIVCMLPKTLGNAFFGSGTKRPLPIRLAQHNKGSKNIEGKIREAIQESVYFYFSGSCSTLRIANTSFTPEQITENVVAAVEALANGFGQGTTRKPSIIPRGWKGVQSFHLKSSSSTALPLYKSLPMSQLDGSKTSKKRPIDEVEDVEAPKSKKTPKRKGKKETENKATKTAKSNAATTPKQSSKKVSAKSTGKRKSKKKN